MCQRCHRENSYLRDEYRDECSSRERCPREGEIRERERCERERERCPREEEIRERERCPREEEIRERERCPREGEIRERERCPREERDGFMNGCYNNHWGEGFMRRCCCCRCCCRCCNPHPHPHPCPLRPEFISAALTSAQTYNPGGCVVFDTIISKEGNAISHTNNTGDFTINEKGYYEISFSASVTGATGVKTPYNIETVIEKNGTEIIGSGVRTVILSSTDYTNLANSIIVYLHEGDRITLSNHINSAVYRNATITIEKL